MASAIEVTVPDIGDFADVEIIEVHVGPGDAIAVDDPLITLESDKATMDVPTSAAGIVTEMKVGVGDKVSEGSVVLLLETDSATELETDHETGDETDQATKTTAQADESLAAETESTPSTAPQDSTEENMQESIVRVPDIGDFSDVEIIEVHVRASDTFEEGQALITLESDKATMDVPAPSAGTVKEMKVDVGDRVSEGSEILLMTAVDEEAETTTQSSSPAAVAVANDEDRIPIPAAVQPLPPPSLPPPAEKAGVAPPHASPTVRRFARELGADLSQVKGSGPKGRILKEDVKAYVKGVVSGGKHPSESPATISTGIPAMPEIDFSKWGEVEIEELPRIKKISGPHLHRAWLNVPHVTHHDEADTTELEAFRQSLKPEAGKRGIRVTALAFIMKAVAAGLKEFPRVNSSLTVDAQSLVFKKYYHIGIAVDTPNGLVVPVFRDVDQKSIFDLAAEMGDVSARARDGKLKSDEMQGGCISISSLGGIGGTAFTPIVNAPEVAILGVTRAQMRPVWSGSEFVPRLMLPLDLSYDHRVIDGAEAARFMAFLCKSLGDLRRLLL